MPKLLRFDCLASPSILAGDQMRCVPFRGPTWGMLLLSGSDTASPGFVVNRIINQHVAVVLACLDMMINAVSC